jgi:hypothetical protein
MPKFEYGFNRAVKEIIGGLVSSVFVEAFVSSGLIPPSFMLLFHLSNAIGTLFLILAMPFWATAYILGWLFGLWVMSESGMVNLFDFLAYFIPLLLVLCVRFWKLITD